MADDLLDLEPTYLHRQIEQSKAEGREVAVLHFNTTDLTVDFTAHTAVIADALEANPRLTTLSVESLLRPFDLAEQLPSRCLTYIKERFEGRWKEAIVWLSALPETSQHPERLATAAVVQSHGDIDELAITVALGRTDWRDLLMNAGDLAHSEWRAVLDGLLGPDGR